MKSTVNQIRLELQAIADSHEQINNFYWGDFLEAVNEQPIDYPLMNCYYTTAELSERLTPIDMVIVVADRTFKSQREGNYNDTESDTLQVCRDVFNVIQRSKRWRAIGRVESASATKFLDRSADEVAGHVLTIRFSVYDSESLCNLPMDGYDFNEVQETQICDRFSLQLQNLPESTRNCILNDNCTFDNVTVFYSNGVDVVDTLGAGDEFTIQAHTVSNSDDSYLVSVEFDENTELPDVTHTDSDGSSVVYPSAKPFVCTPAVAGLAAKVLKTGQITSYRTYDDGDLQEGRDSDFFTLGGNNVFGNTNRFTDELGGQTYTNNIVIDHSTDDGGEILGYYRVANQVNVNWNDAVDGASSLSIGSFSSGWRLPNARELDNLAYYKAGSGGVSYIPMSPLHGFNLWTSTTDPGATSRALVRAFTGQGISTAALAKTSISAEYFSVRNFTYAELGV